jgi:hypothetical protein
LREKTEAAEALAKQEEIADEERRRVRATVREALGRKVRDCTGPRLQSLV